eukprot:TRINITY_DN4187_c0_g1_i2.p1 TRINITY_DN4187_c0_g1~~TRINITY_DN4187_c0_g1_i2.p1  ORF type:complete len:381 (+),score=42.54 TRINITY_DN4187_c0_g1_i2:60-1202(+)
MTRPVLFATLLFATLLGAQRTLTVINSCSNTVWVGSNGGYTQPCVNNQCPTGQGCNPLINPPSCFWTLTNSSLGTNQLLPGQKTTYPLNGLQGTINWSGSIYGKTYCNSTGSSCLTADCGSCSPGTGPVGPTTTAQITLLTNLDSISVHMDEGVNLPLSIAPTPGQSLPYTGASYWCGNPGDLVPASSTLVGCQWKFNTTVQGNNLSTFLRMVPEGGPACSSDSDCTSGQVCGFSSAKLVVCGQLIGYWSPAAVCGGVPYGYPYSCSTAVPGQGTYTNLYLCSGPNTGSCYAPNAPSTCCGCPAWNFNGTTLPQYISCQTGNPNWKNFAEPLVTVLKGACPSAYSFPHDDATSSFQCATSSSPNTVSYTVTFCPSGINLS